MQPPGSKQLLHTSSCSSTILSRVGKTVAVALVLLLACAALLYITNRGFRRSVHFWCHMSPIIAEYKILQAQHSRWIVVGDDEEEAYQQRISQFHQRTAPKLVKLILKMGGIYVKIGQFMSTVGGGLIEDTYLAALAPLQDGIPPRPIHQMANIIETSTGKTMEELFDYFESVPIGAASIAQAHRARLWDGTEVVVKVQYPEVAELYQADFTNLKMVTRLLAPEQLPTVQTLRERHENELDFRQEAAHLQEVSDNMHRHGLQPKLIRIPRVIGNATQHVLCMEYMDGISLKEAMHNELEDIAVAMGYSDAASLRKTIQDNLRQHFLEGGGELTENANDVLLAATRVAPLVRIYAGLNRKVGNARTSLRNGASRALRIASRGKIDPELVEPRQYVNIDLGKVIKLLVMVHGVQVVLDGVYNADPRKWSSWRSTDSVLNWITYLLFVL
jgi:aarF domain-containing kinase